MLTRLSLESARELSELLNNRGRVVEPVEETPLEQLTEVAEPISTVTPQDIASSIESLAETTYTPVAIAPVMHDEVIEQQSTDIADLMNRRLDLARNVINPIIRFALDAVVEEMAKYVPETPIVEEVDFDNFYQHPVLNQVFGGYGNKIGVNPISTLKGITFNEENNFYKNALTTGSAFIDNKLNDIVNKYGEEWYQQNAQRYFTRGEDLAIVKPEVSQNYVEEADKNVLIHMLARHFYNNDHIPQGMDNDAYRLRLLEILARTSQNVNNVVDLQKRLQENDHVTLDVSTESNKIRVYGPVYRSFLERGGNNTMLMGYMHRKQKNILPASSIISQGRSLEQLYDDVTKAEIQQVRSDRLRILLRSMREVHPKVVEQVPNEVILSLPGEISAELQNPQSILLERGYSFINTPAAIDLDDIPGYVTQYVTVGLLPELNLAPFFATMDKHIAPQVGGAPLTPSQAAYYACLEEIVGYYVSQTNVKTV